MTEPRCVLLDLRRALDRHLLEVLARRALSPQDFVVALPKVPSIGRRFTSFRLTPPSGRTDHAARRAPPGRPSP